MIKVLVTGSGGQLGLSLQEIAPKYSNITFIFKTSKELDITKEQDLDIISKSNFDFCINCAAYTNVEGSEKEPAKAYLINSESVKNLSIACNDSDVTLIHISTDYVFDGEKESAYLPSDTPNPINTYGRSKLKGEDYIRQNIQKYFIVRTSWLYSKTYGKNFYRTILNKALNGEDLEVTDEHIGCPTDTMNLSKYLIEELILGNTTFGVHHFSDSKVMTWYDFAKEILQENELAEKVSLVVAKNHSSYVKRPANSVLKK